MSKDLLKWPGDCAANEPEATINNSNNDIGMICSVTQALEFVLRGEFM